VFDWTLVAKAGPSVLVTVAIVEGSGPRECGARMLVTATGQFDTIGGGHLELRAVDSARAMLLDGRERHFERFALGPGLGQCCGGVVHLAFERADAAQAALLAQRIGSDSTRMVAFDGEPESALYDELGLQLAGVAAPLCARNRGTHMMQEQDGRRWLVDAIDAPRAHLTLFGAGHVGAAIVRALADMPCTVTWIDERDDMFPASVPANVTVEATDTPEALVDAAPDGATFLVMTHSHALDQRLTEAIMAREGVQWFGLIGSMTKRKQFEHRLRARGVPAAKIDAMVCPIGLPGIANKAPAVIAASVCAQLLAVWEAAAAQSGVDATPVRLVQNSKSSR
jgi:xanthine dehydrogenase accessory factor